MEAAVEGVQLEILPNPSPCEQHSLVVDHAHAVEVATFLKNDEKLKLDFASNVTGVDWLDSEVIDKVTRTEVVDGEEKEVVEKVPRTIPGYLETVYHLYSMELKHGPLVLRMRTGNRSDQVTMPSLTPVYRSAEFQEREVYDLYGIVFENHPDLRRILMWDGFEDHPMRKDYEGPDDYEYEPTPHAAVLEKAKFHKEGGA